ncbi:MAG: hypothetical protein ACJA1I_001225 [Zhongshania marina]
MVNLQAVLAELVPINVLGVEKQALDDDEKDIEPRRRN